ncbi:MAG TPA: SpoIIE family protein phosphatase [Roseiflexaceae bacterium]|nr:SpoIIE family protein phosphatase [Roseiflexaceae bacterium]
MASRLRQFWQMVRRRSEGAQPITGQQRVASASRRATAPVVEIAPDDPLAAYFLSTPGVVEIDKLVLVSPALAAMKANGVKLVVPLVSQGELLGVLNLGPRLSQQEYSSDDRALLNNLATQAAPALRVAQLVRQQQADARERERIDQELRVARLIQQTLLPKSEPQLPGWQISAHYQPARAVGGDFYDFIELPDGRLTIIVGDVTDKGVPAALVMATTRSILRGAVRRLMAPGAVLQRTNELLLPEIPPKMFVTCLCAVLDPANGRLHYANAGHDLPYRRYAGGVEELRAVGMPLGLMQNMQYEEHEITLAPGDSLLFYSDGLVEAHNMQHEMFGFPRLQAFVESSTDVFGPALIPNLLAELNEFVGPEAEQEDDITLVSLQRLTPATDGAHESGAHSEPPEAVAQTDSIDEQHWQLVAEWNLPSAPGNERMAMESVAQIAQSLMPPRRLERLKTAVAEATMNAMEHGSQYRVELPVLVQVYTSEHSLAVRVTDRGGPPPGPAEVPDIAAKLAGLQSPRGWGLFLIEKLVDELRITNQNDLHTVELIMHREGASDVGETA